MPFQPGDESLISDLYLLALTIWREARGEPPIAQRGVASVIMRRARLGGWWGSSITAVCVKPWQFSSLTDPKDPQLSKWPALSDPAWTQAMQVAIAAVDGSLVSPCPTADSYYDISIVPPKWATPETFVGEAGRLRFYQTRQDASTPTAA
jgi:spore germination cell wall hydrolase CwlJ-like protein